MIFILEIFILVAFNGLTFLNLVLIYFRVYNLTLASFVVAFLHFLTETFIYKSCTIETFGVFTPIIVSGKTC